MKVAVQVVVSPEQREVLEKLARGRKASARVVERARIVLLAAEGKQNQEIAKICGVTRKTASLWRRRLVEEGIAVVLRDAPRAGRRRSMGEEGSGEIVRRARRETPVSGSHWSTRSMGK